MQPYIKNLPPPPSRSTFLTPDGYVSQEWLKWFSQSYLRVGGSSGDTIYDGLDTTPDVYSIQAELLSLRNEMSASIQGLQTQIQEPPPDIPIDMSLVSTALPPPDYPIEFDLSALSQQVLSDSLGALTLDSLTDVTITGPVANQVLKYNGTLWVNAAAAGSGGGVGYEEFVAAALQTVFNTTIGTVAKAAGKVYLAIYVNGIFQQEGAAKSYTVTGANQITFNAGLVLNDDVVMYQY